MKRKFVLKKTVCAILSLLILVTALPYGWGVAYAETNFVQQNILQVNAKSSGNYICGDWYNYNNGAGIIRDTGCGIVSLVSAVYNLGGTIAKNNVASAIKEVGDWAKTSGYWSTGGVSWGMFASTDDKFGSKYGFNVLETSNTYGCYGAASGSGQYVSLDNLVNHLKNESGTAVVHVHGHYMAVVDYKSENGVEKLLVFDPAPGADTYWNSLNRRNITNAAGNWFPVSLLTWDGGQKGVEGSDENIEINGYWLIAPLNGSSVVDPANPDSFTVPSRDLIYNSSSAVQTGSDVKWLQSVLVHLGYSIAVDGSYGPASRDTIKKFQGDYGLSKDGMAGPKTRAKLKELWSSKGHTWDSGTVIEEPTHTSTGLKKYNCNYCEASKEEIIAKLTTHKFDQWDVYDNSSHIRTCECGETEITPHIWSFETVVTEPTHISSGSKTYVCELCYAMKNETIDKLKNHEFGSWQNMDNDNHKRICECGEIEIAIHSWDSGVITTPPTTSSEGIKTYTCSTCNAQKNGTIPKLDSTTPEPSPNPEQTYIPGDINGDGMVDDIDIETLAKYFADWDVDVNEKAIDVNGDGLHNNKDVSRLSQYLMGWDVEVH